MADQIENNEIGLSVRTKINAALAAIPFLQPMLYSGTSIKTVNGNSLLGAGDVSTIPAWGQITGTLSSQTDLSAALAGKADSTHTHISTSITDFVEAAQDAVGAAFDTTLAYNDAGNAMGRAAISGDVSIPAGSNTATLATVPVTKGGTGAITLTGYVKGNGTVAMTASATIPSTDITGLGSMAVQASTGVAITGGSITGITDLAIADGGTGASDAATARSNLGLGTISTQASSSVSISGGAIDGTVIGATVAAAGTFTSVTSPSHTTAGTLSLSATGANVVNISTNGVVRQTIDASGVVIAKQAAPTSLGAAATLTAAQVTSGIIQYTGAAATLTLPTGATLDAYYATAVDMAFDLSIINTGTGAATIAAATGITIVGAAAVTNGTSAGWRFRRTAASTWIAYRIR